MTNLRNITLKALAIFVSDHLTKNGIEAILTGGACVSIYTDNTYVSSDLDFVLLSYEKRDKIIKIMGEAGFYLKDKHFQHSDTNFFIEFLSPPASIGDEPVKEISVIEEEGRLLKLLSPTDCVKDRLAAFYDWNDRQSLEQALLVCKSNPVDLREIERWSKKELMTKKFNFFKSQISKK
jgi:hypothetical protein